MSEFQIGLDLEFTEVVNEFPCLKNTLNRLHIRIDDLNEGESIENFFKRKHMDLEEENIVLRKLNRDLNHFLKNGELPKNKRIHNFVSFEEE